jgi:hypothetical protein
MLINLDIINDIDKISQEILGKDNITDFRKLYLYILLASASKYFQQFKPEIAEAYANKSKILERELFYVRKDSLEFLSDALCKLYYANKLDLPRLMKSYLFRERGRHIITYAITKNVSKEELGEMMGFYLNGYIFKIEEPLAVA